MNNMNPEVQSHDPQGVAAADPVQGHSQQQGAFPPAQTPTTRPQGVAAEGQDGPANTKPDYLPANYWKDGIIDTKSLATDAAKWRRALSAERPAVPSDVSGYDFSGLDIPEEMKGAYAELAYKLALTPYQAKELFGEEGAKFTERFEGAAESENTAAYVSEQVAAMGGPEKMREAVEVIDNFFGALRNRNIMSESEVAEFKHTALTNAAAVKGFVKMMGAMDGSGPQPAAGVASMNGGLGQNQFAGMTRDQAMQEAVSRLHLAKTKGEKDAIYTHLDKMFG